MSKRVKVICKTCEKEHESYQSQTDGSGFKFCSKKCFDDSRRNGSVVKCQFCDTEFYRRYGEQKKALIQFCSKECYFNDRILSAKKTTYLKFGSVHRHIFIAEKTLGRKLKKGEIVHHIDENKHNNIIENLAVLPSQSFHAQVHFGKVTFEEYKLINLIK